MALYGDSRDVSLVRTVNRELMGNIITQQASFYKFKLKETPANVYGEAANEKFYDGPIIFNCLVKREDEEYSSGDLGVTLKQNVLFAFLRDDLKDANVVPEIGDILLYEETYFGVEGVVENRYWLGKDPDYANEPNPLNTGLSEFGNNLSTLVQTYYIPADKVNISPYKERS